MMTQNTILKIAVPSPIRSLFDYRLPETTGFDPQVGARVQVSFGRQNLVGVIMEISADSTLPYEKLKRVENILDETPVLSPHILELCRFASEYYHHPLGEVCQVALPRNLRIVKNSRKQKNKKDIVEIDINHPLTLNTEQQFVLDKIRENLNDFKTFLLEGVTGSGKTEVYLQILEDIIAQDKQVLVLIPEIGLTPQTVHRFRSRFKAPTVFMHSGLTEKEHYESWEAAAKGIAKIVIGTRSAIFTPLPHLGMIIIDEEHDTSFRQQEGFRYCARNVAIRRAQIANVPIILGSATPSIESLMNAKRNRFEHLKLQNRAGAAEKPRMHLVDMRRSAVQSGLSDPLLTAMSHHLNAGNQVLLFINRRGYAPTLLCHQCGLAVRCKYCDVNLTFHQEQQRLICHHCGYSRIPITHCEFCKGRLIYVGFGTEKIESFLAKKFEQYPVIRIDKDSTRKKNALADMIEKINKGDPLILLGTQMLAKGHHFPNITLSAILQADTGFLSADFRGSERMGQLITQVSGRSGRAEKPGEVLIQTHSPQNPLLQTLIQAGYTPFCETIIKERNEANLPPFSFLAIVRSFERSREKSEQLMAKIKSHAMPLQENPLEILGPIPALIEKRKGFYPMNLLIQSKNRSILHGFLKKFIQTLEEDKSIRKGQWYLEVDPTDII